MGHAPAAPIMEVNGGDGCSWCPYSGSPWGLLIWMSTGATPIDHNYSGTLTNAHSAPLDFLLYVWAHSPGLVPMCDVLHVWAATSPKVLQIIMCGT